MINLNLPEIYSKFSPFSVSLLNLLAIERTKTIYLSFSNSEPEIDFNIESAISESFKYLYGDTKVHSEKLLKKIEESIHDSDDFSSVRSDLAQCSIIGLFYSVQFLKNKDEDSFYYVFQKIDEILDILQGESESFLEIEEKELIWQEELVERLSCCESTTEDFVNSLRVSNLQHLLPTI